MTQAEIDLMNEIKSKGVELDTLILKLQAAQIEDEIQLQRNSSGTSEPIGLAAINEARRWTAIGKTDLQRGLMALTRAVARPTGF